jgi:hypothetical protein
MILQMSSNAVAPTAVSERADRAASEGAWADGDAMYAAALALDPANTDLLSRRAKLAARFHRWVVAACCINELSRLEPTQSSHRIWLADVLVNAGDWVGAEKGLAWISVDAGNELSVMLAKGRLAMACGNHTAAVAIARRATELRPDHSGVAYSLVRGLIAMECFAEADAELALLAPLAGSSLQHRQLRLVVRSVAESPRQLLDAWRTLATEAIGTSPGVTAAAISWLVRHDDLDFARQLLSAMTPSSPSPEWYMLSIALDEKHDRLAEARTVAAEGARWFPESLRFHRAAVRLMQKQSLPDLAADKAMAILRQFPDHLEHKRWAAEALVHARRDREALDIIASIEDEWADPVVLKLRAWGAGRDEQADLARRCWLRAEGLLGCRSSLLDATSLVPLRIAEVPVKPGRCTLFTVLRNESLRLPYFLAYFRELGVDRIVAIDNDSEDDTRDQLLADPLVTLYATSASYASSKSGIAWLNALLTDVPDGHWALYADADELLVYPDSEWIRLPELLAYLEDAGHEAMVAPMLDLFPRTIELAASYQAGTDFRCVASHFEPAREWRGSVECPYSELYGGMRQRLFWPDSRGNNQMKVPLMRGGRGARLLSSSHIVSPLRVSDVMGAMLHFKFIGDCRESVHHEVLRREQPGGAAQWRAYKSALDGWSSDASLLGSGTLKYESTRQLEELGICRRGRLMARAGAST